MKKYTRFLLLLLVVVVLGSFFFVEHSLYAEQYKTTGNAYYTVIEEDGSIKTIPYNEIVTPDYFSGHSDESISLQSETEIDLNDISYGVARILGYTSYSEYDGIKTKQPRTGYTHGTSANDAAFIAVLNDGQTVRVKQAGIYMDIPLKNVKVSEYNENSEVSYYMGNKGQFYHYYYNGTYGKKATLSKTMVGYTPDYLKDGVKYYSYDGHYFYTNYKNMIDDYKAGVNVYKNAINEKTPYYNYYQYLSFRAPTSFTENQINDYVQHKINTVSSINENSKLHKQANALLNTQNLYGINASLMLGVAINESGWGMSYYALDRNNLFGLNATDQNPNNAYRFDSVEDCLYYFASKTISAGYLDGSDSRYRGPHLGDKQSGINVSYSSDPYWGEKAASYSYMLNDRYDQSDYLKYKIAISTNGNVMYYKENDLNKVIYSSGASVNSKTNYFVYNIPFTILQEDNTTYKIYSDTVLKDDRNVMNVSSGALYNVLRDYVYINKKEAQLIYECQDQTIYPLGDVNGDEKVSAVDYITIKNHITKTKLLSDDQLMRADINKDNKISAVDYIMIKNHIMGVNKLF